MARVPDRKQLDTAPLHLSRAQLRRLSVPDPR